MPELRKDPIIDRWVVLASARKSRPTDFLSTETETDSRTCPFCPGNEDNTPPEVFALRPDSSSPNTDGWTVRVVPNKFAGLESGEIIEATNQGLYQSMPGVGFHEVIIESPDHRIALENLSSAQMTACFSTFKQRILTLQQNPIIQYVLIFKNHGRAAGATLSHGHCQLIALPLVPELLQREIKASRHHHQNTGRCLYCDLIQEEKQQNLRWVSENDAFVAFCPYAPRFPYETWILPKTHQAAYEKEIDYTAFSSIYKDVLLRIQTILPMAPHNFVLHTAPDPNKDNFYYHWHLEILPKVTQLAGFEFGTGAFLNHTSPEDAAELLRQVQL